MAPRFDSIFWPVEKTWFENFVIAVDIRQLQSREYLVLVRDPTMSGPKETI